MHNSHSKKLCSVRSTGPTGILFKGALVPAWISNPSNLSKLRWNDQTDL